MSQRFPPDVAFCDSLTDFFSSSNVGLAVLDRQMRYEALNPWLANVQGYSIEFHLGKTLRKILGEVAPRIEPAIHCVLDTGQPISNVEVVGKLPHKTEAERWLDHIFPIKDQRGQVRRVGIVVIPLPAAARPAEKDSHRESTPPSVLRSWKEIAAYVRTCSKTVQRWEQTSKFPIRRVQAGKGAVVYAIRDEVDNWLLSGTHGATTALGDKRSWATFIDSSLPTLVLDDERIILDANVGIANLIGTRADQLVGSRLDNFTGGTGADSAEREWRLFREAGASVGLRNFCRVDKTAFAAKYTLRTIHQGARILTFTALHQDPVCEKQIFYQAGPAQIDS